MQQVPSVTFKTRVRNDALEGPNPFEWKELTTDELFKGKRVVVFALPGAFTPTCSSTHLPRYEELYDEFAKLGVDRIVCASVNDAFVMFQWGKAQGVKNIFLLPDGNGEFTRKMGMLVDKSNSRLRHAQLALLHVRRRRQGGEDVRGGRLRRQLPDGPVPGLRRRHDARIPEVAGRGEGGLSQAT